MTGTISIDLSNGKCSAPAERSAEDSPRTWRVAIDELLLIRRLEDDWDGRGAAAPSAELVDGAIRLAQSLDAIGHRPAGRVTPGPSGTISFEWYQDGDYTEIEVTAPNRAEGRSVASGSSETRTFSIPGVPFFSPVD